ncbi:partitioning defective 3 homolog B isoform X1 [Petromyzon marinus]|uniref:partitioning defective 3 homolog B isoform X1 n=1 Tax=Petromyzon marinus TaxID=7757 RepID=UPI003F711678
MKVIVYFKDTSVLVPCGDGHILVKDLIRQAVTRYKKAFNKDASHPVLVQYLQHADGGILDSDDRLCDICDDKDKLIAVYEEPGMGASDESPAPQRRSFVETTSPLTPPSDAWAASAFHPYRPDLGQGNATASTLPSGAAARIHHSGDGDPHRPPGEPPTRCAPLFDGRATPPPPGAAPGMGPAFPAGQDRGTPSCDARDYEENGNNIVKSSLRKNDLVDWSSCLSDFCKVIHVPSEGGPLGIHIVHFGTKLRRSLGLLVRGVDEQGRAAHHCWFEKGDCIVIINGNNLLDKTFDQSQQIFMQAMRVGVMVIHVVPAQQLESYQRALELIDPDSDTPNGGLGSMSPPSCFSPMDSRFDFGVSGGGGGAKAGATETRGGGEPPGSPKGHASPGGVVSGLRKLSTPTALGCLSRKLSKKASIRLKKGPEGLGFTIATKEGPIGEHNPLYVKSVLPRGAAVADGRMKPGDQLLEVNGQEVAGKSQEEVVSLLRATRLGGAVTLSLRRQEDTFLPRPIQKAGGDGDEVEGPAAGTGSATAPPPETPRRMFTYEIPLNDSGSAGLGISVKGSREDDTDLGIFVKSIIFGGAASKDGRLRVNDQLVAVNGQSLLGRTNSEAMEVLRRSMSTDGNVRGMIQIVVARRAVRFSQPIVPQGSFKAVSPGHVDQTHSDYNSLLYHTTGAHQSGLKNGILGGWGTLPRDRELADSPPPPLPPRRTPLLNHSSWTDGGSGPRGTQWPPAVTSVGWCHDSEDEPGWPSVQGHGRGLGDDGPADGIRHRKSRSMDIIADENDRGRASQQRAGWNTRSVGPSLGLVMSSSLESLQAAVAAASGANDGGELHHDGDFYYDDDDDDDDYDGGDGGGDSSGHGVFSPGRPRSGLGRGRACNASFRAAIDKSYEEGGGGAGMGASDAESWVTESRSAGSSRHGRGEGEGSDPDTLEEETVDSPRWRPPKALTNRLQSLSQPGSPRGRHNGRGTAGKEKKSKPEKERERGKDRDKEKKEGIMKGLGVMFRFGKSKKEEKAVKVERKGSRRDDSILTDEEISMMRREQERIQAKHRELREQQARDRELKLQRERDSLGAASRSGPESRHRPSSPPSSRGNAAAAASVASEPLPSPPGAGGAALPEMEDDDLDPAYARVSRFLVAEDRGAAAGERVASSAPAATAAAPVAATQNSPGVVVDADIDALYAKVDKTRRLSAPRSAGGSGGGGGSRPPSSSEERVAQLRHEFQKLRADEARTTDAGSADGMTEPVPGPAEHRSGRHSVSVEMQQQQQRRWQEEREGLLLSPTRRRYNSLPRLAKKSPPRSQSGPPGSVGWAFRGADDASAWNGHAGRPAHPSSCHSLEEEEGGAAVFEFPCTGRRAHSPLRRDVPPPLGGGGGTPADAPNYAAEMQRLAGPAAARPNRV